MNARNVVRGASALLVATVALFFTLVVFGNLTDYGSNYAFVEGVLKMDTTFGSPSIMWRSIESSAVHHAFYWSIIRWEAVVAVLAWIGAGALFKNIRKSSADFDKAKGWALAALAGGMLLWLLAFITVGGEWFAMWQSSTWNGTAPAFRMFTVLGVVFLILMHKDNGGK